MKLIIYYDNGKKYTVNNVQKSSIKEEYDNEWKLKYHYREVKDLYRKNINCTILLRDVLYYIIKDKKGLTVRNWKKKNLSVKVK